MLIYTAQQGTPEWHAARAGVITGSMFRTAREKVGALDDRQQTYVNAMLSGAGSLVALQRSGYKKAPSAEVVMKALRGESTSEPSNAAKDYAFRLAVERISGQPLDEGFETWQMRRGHELEPEARAAHELHAGVTVEPCGFVTTDDGLFGASADGLVDVTGGAEYKCLVSPERLRETLITNDISDYMDQVQGGMWITGRNWWDFCIYCPALAPIGRALSRWRVPRDDNYIEAMERELIEFSRLVSSYETELRKPLPLAA